jgi:glucose/arabinose dehydrogenase
MLVTEKIGPIWLVSARARRSRRSAARPRSTGRARTACWASTSRPTTDTDQSIYITYIEPGDYGGGQALARAKLNVERVPRLENFEVIWRQMPRGKGGQAGGQIAFAADGQSLFMTVGDRQRMTPAQDRTSPWARSST